MQKTRREAIDELLDFVGELNDTGARDSAERIFNRALESIWMKHSWSQFASPAPLQVTLVANQRSYALPDHFGRFRSLRKAGRNVTRGTDVDYINHDELLEQHPEAGTALEVASDPYLCTIAGVCGVSTQPSPSGEALEVVSSSVADTDIKVSIVGDDSSGRNLRSQVTLNGTTAVAIGTWGYVDEFGKAYPAGTDPATEYYSSRGTVTLRKVSGGTVLQTLFPEESSRKHQVLTVYPKAVRADVLSFPFIRGVNRLVHDADPLPANWGPAVFEEMFINWRVMNGDVRDAASIARPSFLELVQFENLQTRRGTTPFGA